MKTNRNTSPRFHLTLFAAILLTAFLVFLFPGCNDSSSDSQTGTLAVSITDEPACGFDAVNVSISKVRVHQSRNAAEDDAGWAEIILDPARKLNLLDLTNGALEELGQMPLAAGQYSQLRLVLAANDSTVPANSVIPTGTSNEIALDTPSALQSGLKLINEFEVLAGERVDVVLDFNACKSVVTRGNSSYGLKPVIQVLPVTLSGIGGFVTSGTNVTVSAQSNGSIVRSTVVNPLSGEFFISHLAPGTYDVVITAAGEATAVVSGVPIVNASSTAMLSTPNAPIILPPSATRNISGTITLSPLSGTEVAAASAKQTFLSGPTVTVQTQLVDLFSNAYTLTLPSAAPLLAAYGSGVLPLTLTAQSAMAGLYSIEAAAPGYQTQEASKDITAADATQDFILTP